jgi:hypothetical protein
LLEVARRIDLARLEAHERGEAARVLSGIASALRYEDLRSSGLVCVDGWDKHSPDVPGLSPEHSYRLQTSNFKTYVSEPVVLQARSLAALAGLAEAGWSVAVDARGALRLPGESLRVVMRHER